MTDGRGVPGSHHEHGRRGDARGGRRLSGGDLPGVSHADRERSRSHGTGEHARRDVDYFDDRADRFRSVQSTLEERACVSPARNADGATGVERGTLATPAAYGTIDDIAVIDAADLPDWYRDRVSRGETLPQRIEGRTLETAPAEAGTDDLEELLAAEEYLRLDVLVDGEVWDTYVPVPRSPAEYDSSALATLRERLDGRPIERFHCARMPIRYEDGRYVPDYGPRTFDRWLREQGFVRWTAENGYELKPGLRAAEVAAWAVALCAGALLAGSVTLAFLALWTPELFLLGLWFVLPMTYLCSVEIARRGFESAFKRLGLLWRRRSIAANTKRQEP